MEHSRKDTSWNESKYQNKKITLLLIVCVSSVFFLAIFYHFHRFEKADNQNYKTKQSNYDEINSSCIQIFFFHSELYHE